MGFKCDKLKVETIVPQGSAITLQMYGKAEVDEAIAELKDLLKAAQQDRNDWKILCEETQKHIPSEI